MFQPRGHALQSCVIALTALSFMQIGFDNGLMGGLGSCCAKARYLPTAKFFDIVTTNSFNKTFNTPSQTIVSVIVAIFEGLLFLNAHFRSS